MSRTLSDRWRSPTRPVPVPDPAPREFKSREAAELALERSAESTVTTAPPVQVPLPPRPAPPAPVAPGAALIDAKVRLHGRIIDEFNLALIDKLSRRIWLSRSHATSPTMPLGSAFRSTSANSNRSLSKSSTR